jgi:hypothetical protein
VRELFASGGNYQVFVEDGLVEVVVWRRPDVSLVQGAAFAREIVAQLTTLAARDDVNALLLDLVDAPPVNGPQTQAAVAEMLQTFSGAGRRTAIVVGDSPMRQMQFERLMREQAGPTGGVFRLTHQARAFLRR